MITEVEKQHKGLKAATARLLYAVADRLDGVGKHNGVGYTERPLRQAIAPIHLVSDFNNNLSPTECEQKMKAIFKREGVLYEPPHQISDIQPFNITDGAFQIYQLVHNQRREGLPGIFVGVVDPGVGSQRRGVVVTTEEGYTFVGPDNGLFYPTLETLTIKDAYKIADQAFADSTVTFHGRDQFSPLAAESASGKDPSQLPQLERIDQRTLVKKKFILGQVVDDDGYRNLKIWQRGIPTRDGQKAKELIIEVPMSFRGRSLWLRTIKAPVVEKFEDVRVGEWLVLEGSSCSKASWEENQRGLIDLAIRDRVGKDGAGGRLGVTTGDVLELKWKF